jgi:hypothetical protein
MLEFDTCQELCLLNAVEARTGLSRPSEGRMLLLVVLLVMINAFVA